MTKITYDIKDRLAAAVIARKPDIKSMQKTANVEIGTVSVEETEIGLE